MLRIDRSVPVRITLERIPPSGNQAEVMSAAMKPAHRIDAALAGNQRREGQPHASSLIPRADSSVSAYPPGKRCSIFHRERFRRGYDPHVAVVTAPFWYRLLGHLRKTEADSPTSISVNRAAISNRVEATAPRVRFGELVQARVGS